MNCLSGSRVSGTLEWHEIRRECDGTGRLSPSAFARAGCPFEQKSVAYAAA